VLHRGELLQRRRLGARRGGGAVERRRLRLGGGGLEVCLEESSSTARDWQGRELLDRSPLNVAPLDAAAATSNVVST
jgi:hypothetical protein